MINIHDHNALEKIIELERQLGWTRDGVGKRWEEEVREDIENLRKAARDGISFSSILPDGIYGQGGWDKYGVKPDGEIVFLRELCSHMNKDHASQIAEKVGFRVQ